MTTSRPSRAPTSERRADEQKVREALAVLSQTERLEALRNVPLSRSVKLGGASRIVLGARENGLLVARSGTGTFRPQPSSLRWSGDRRQLLPAQSLRASVNMHI